MCIILCSKKTFSMTEKQRQLQQYDRTDQNEIDVVSYPVQQTVYHYIVEFLCLYDEINLVVVENTAMACSEGSTADPLTFEV